MARTAFESLRIYRLSEELADAVWDMVSDWNALAKDTIGKQLIRAADGIGANIAEGSGRGSYQDNRRFVRIARGSLYETKHWLRRAFVRKLLKKEHTDRMASIIENMAPQLNAYLRSIGSKRSDAAGTTDQGLRTTDL
jgi:four helix bundle protein